MMILGEKKMANNVIELKGKRFVQASKTPGSMIRSMNGKFTVTCPHLHNLHTKLLTIRDFWEKESRFFDGVLINVVYNKIAAKSNRIGELFKGTASNSAIVGAKFSEDKTKHIITYFLDIKDLNKSIEKLSSAYNILLTLPKACISGSYFDNKSFIDSIPFSQYKTSKSAFRGVIADASFVENFEVGVAKGGQAKNIITLYDTKTDTIELLKKIGINLLFNKVIDKHTILLNEEESAILFEKAPYLVSMATTDLSTLSPDHFIEKYQKSNISIPLPTIEPTIGVIDTLFDESVYFGEWVDYYDMVDVNIPRSPKDYNHGTAVTSIIVDGPRLNPWLNDGCGRFKVRHFGVAIGSQFSSFNIIKQIKEIISKNKDIKVWNISLGSNQEVNDNFISAEAAILDQIQFENDVIFVVAGTNKPNQSINRIGSPADSINSMVVNAVTKDKLPTNYSRKGIVLSFFAKPDVSFYGGCQKQYMAVYEPQGESKVSGTSFAAPWIARKLSYLIDVLGINKELAKALIIDAARGWNNTPTLNELELFGHGVVPVHIQDIISTKNDEIRFLVSDVSEKWNTYNYHFPIPIENGSYPYLARATMCYFPKCNRAQGVDYTNTELNLHFGRLNDDGKIIDIKGDKQNDEISIGQERNYLLESEARQNFRKWDNVKYKAETFKAKNKARKCYDYNKNLWGMEIKTANRLDPKDGEGIRFGVVVTLKEINGVNRIDEFIKNCHLNGWLVNVIDVEAKVDIFQVMNQDIDFE